MQPERGNIREQDCPLGYFVSNTFINSDNITFTTSSSLTFTGDIWPVRKSMIPYFVDPQLNRCSSIVHGSLSAGIISASDSSVRC